jgi:hypothetical protein
MLHRISREQGRFWFEDEDSILINNRQNGRRRGRGGQRPQGGGNQGSRDNGNRIDSRARGNASQLYEKYKNMASDAQRQGDRVNTEYYLQFADHYFRVLADQRGRYEDNNRERRPQNDFDGDEEYGDEGEAIRADEQGRGGQDDRGDRSSRQRDDRPRGQRDDDRARMHRDDEQRADGEQGAAQRSDNRRPDGDRQRERRPRYNGQREGQPREEFGGDVASSGSDAGAPDRALTSDAEAPTSQPPVSQSSVAGEGSADATLAPKRRGRPRKVVAEDGDQLGFDASALPPAIGAEDSAGDAAPKPRRRRTIVAPAEVDA